MCVDVCLYAWNRSLTKSKTPTNVRAATTAGVPFKSVLPWTPENNEALAKACNKYKNKLPGAIEAAEADMGRPKDDRNPGPPDVKAIRKVR